MKRSAQVIAPLVASAAVGLLTSCRQQPEMQRCVDEHNVVVADSFCKNLPAASGASRPGGFGMVPLILPYRYYYGGYGGYGVGSVAGGGGYSAIGGHNYSSSAGVSRGTVRGGFGSSFGGGSEGGGE